MPMQSYQNLTYLFGWNHDTDLLNGLGELIGLDSSVSVQVEVLEGFLENLLLRGDAGRFLLKLVLQLFLKALIIQNTMC